MDDVIYLSTGTKLNAFCLQLQAALYNQEQNSALNVAEIEAELAEMRRYHKQSRREAKRTEAYALPPLYRS